MNPQSRTRWLAPAAIMASMVALAGLVHAQDVESKPKADVASETELTNRQGQVGEKFRELKAVLIRMAELTATTDPRRATLLRQAVAQANERGVDGQFETLIELLKQEQFSKAVKGQGDVKQDLDAILELLLSEDRGRHIESEKERVRNYIKQVNRLIKEQKVIQAETTGDSETKKLADDEEKLREKTAELARTIEKNEGKSASSENQPAKDNPEKGEPSKDAESGEKKDTDEAGEDKKEKGEKDGSKNAGDKKSDGGKADEKKADDEKSDDKEKGDKKDKDKENSDPSENKKEAKDAEAKEQKEANDGKQAKDGNQQDAKGESGKENQGESESGEQQKEQQQQEQAANPAQQRLKQAQERMKEAQRKLEEAKRSEAKDKQEDAIRELEQAKAELEEILRQLREEEIARMLAALETRFRKMLQMQIAVYEGTKRLDRVSDKDRDRDDEIESGRLSRKEAEIVSEADRAMAVLAEDGTAVAFPEAVEEMREDMEKVVVRLADFKVNMMTQGLEEDIISGLEEMIEALKKAQKELRDRRPPPPGGGGGGGGQPQEDALVDQIAELKMIRALQMRVNRRTQRYGELIKTEQADQPELLDALDKLAEREQKIYRVTRDIVAGRNK
jgi:hypothetical protein